MTHLIPFDQSLPFSGDGFQLRGVYEVWCHDRLGKLLWHDRSPNLIVNEGINFALANGISGQTWYMGLLGSTPVPAAGWTVANIAPIDFVSYSEDPLPEWVEGAPAAQAVTNASPVTFTITGPGTVGGLFIVSNSTKATPAGTLLSAVALSGGDQPVVATNVLSATYTITGTSP